MSQSGSGSGNARPEKLTEERLAIAVDAWKYVVSVQMHFNEMEMKVRNLYFTILAASMGLIGVVQGKRFEIIYPDIKVSLSLFVIAAIVPISMLFYFMDRHWYHRLLQGAVKQCMDIEARYVQELPEIQLGSKISIESPVELSGRIWKLLLFFIGEKRFVEKSILHSDAKIELLYKSVVSGAIAALIVYGALGGVKIQKCSLISIAFNLPCEPTVPGKRVNVSENLDRFWGPLR